MKKVDFSGNIENLEIIVSVVITFFQSLEFPWFYSFDGLILTFYNPLKTMFLGHEMLLYEIAEIQMQRKRFSNKKET